MKRFDAGFSLIEVLVAMVIFAIVSLATTNLMVGSTAMVSRNDATSQAINFAQMIMENLRNIPFDEMESGSDTLTNAQGREFSVAWDVAEDAPADGMNTVNVSVSWDEKGTTKQYEIDNILAKVSNVDND
ncbi:MAG: prepilin-type N-terminal cleavage/methylation domain-containing protein [Candidatus Binatia bacterium]